jgi:hypothetical protein
VYLVLLGALIRLITDLQKLPNLEDFKTTTAYKNLLIELSSVLKKIPEVVGVHFSVSINDAMNAPVTEWMNVCFAASEQTNYK